MNMEMDNINTRLLQESDQYAEMMFWRNSFDDSDSEDSFSEVSSGYESTGCSIDSQSVSSEESCVIPKQPIKYSTEKTNFQSVQPLYDSLELILSVPDLCDVMFVVGPEQVSVYAVKAILACRSRKMYELIIKNQNMKKEEQQKQKKEEKREKYRKGSMLCDKLVIAVKKYDVVVFQALIKFIHCGTVTITDENLAGLFCGASQFELHELKKACLDYIERRVQETDITTLWWNVRKYSHHKASTVLFDMVYGTKDKRTKKYREISV